MSNIYDELTVDDFKLRFANNFPYLPVWEEGKVYFEGDEVYVSPNFYQSLVNNNTAEVTDTASWEVVQDSIANYVSDGNIENAKLEAISNYDPELSTDNDNGKLIFLYLWAFFVAYDMSVTDSGGSVTFPATDVTVGSVHEGYYVPKAYLEDPVLGFYARNGFGLKYLNLVYARTIGNVGVVAGWSLP